MFKISVIIYFIAQILYTFYGKIIINEDLALLFKPITIPAICLAYYFHQNKNKDIWSYILFGMLFVADNLLLFKEYEFKKINMIFYSLSLIILFYFQTLSTFEKITNQSKFLVQLLLSLIAGLFICIYIFNIDFGFKSPELIIVIFYIFILILSIVFSLYSFIKFKSISSKYFLFTISALFTSDLFFAIHRYYYSNLFLLILSCVLEVLIYYFLLLFLIKKDFQYFNK